MGFDFACALYTGVCFVRLLINDSLSPSILYPVDQSKLLFFHNITYTIVLKFVTYKHERDPFDGLQNEKLGVCFT